MIFDIVKGDYKSRAKSIAVNELKNFYVELEDGEKAKNIKALIGCPGYRLIEELHDVGYIRAIYSTSNDRMFVIAFDKIFEINTNEESTERGTINTEIGICNICDNGSELLIVDGTDGWIYTLATNNLAKITDAHFPAGATHCIFTDGYFIVNQGDTGRFYFSASYDGTDWDALDFATAEYSSDNISGIVKTSNGTLWMIGKFSTELWSNVGASDLPWRRIQGTVQEIGTNAPYSIATNGSQVFFLSYNRNNAIYMGSGYDLIKISNSALEYQIKQLDDIETAIGFCYTDEGHNFYVISFTDQITYVYDITNKEWHQRGTWDADAGLNKRQQAQGYTFFNSKHYVGSYDSGKLFEMNLSIYNEDSGIIKRVITTSHVNHEHKTLKHKRLELEFERGIGLVGEAAPQIMMQFSNDGGHTWSSEEWVDASKGAGAIGEFQERALWHRLGSSKDRVYRWTMTDPVKWIIINGYLEVKLGKKWR